MVRRSGWSDKQLEDLLRQMPKIKDNRNPRDIYQNLSIEKKRKRPSWLLPGFASAAALLLIIVLVPKLLVGNHLSLDKSVEEKSSQENMSIAQDNSSSFMKKQEAAQKEEGLSQGQPKILMSGNQKNALYDDELGNGRALTYWIPDQMGQILVPISTVIDPGSENDWLTLFTKGMNHLREEEWGLSDYYPINANFTYNNEQNRVLVDVPEDHTYGQGAANETIFLNVLKNDISSNSNIKEIGLSTNGKPGIEFGNYGLINQVVIEERNYAHFFFTPKDRETTYIVPSNQSYEDIITAFDAMKTGQPEFGLEASIGSGFSFKDVSINSNVLTITFDDHATLKDDTATLYSFEAILLTAKEFGVERILLVNSPLGQLGPFDLTQEIKVPIAANYIPIE
nr:hypothetical protein [Neobacillus sp. Marseille-Q6967]